jgi:ACS family glucarate transporter-like MFS transporter
VIAHGARHTRGLRVRWSIFLFLFAFAFLAYIQRTSVAIAAERMMPTLGLTQLEIGWLITAFLVSYTAFQCPGGLLGQRRGARWTLALLGLLAFAATMMTAAVPWLLRGSGLVVAALLVARFTLGIAQAPIFPVCSGVIENWFPVAHWPAPQGLLNAGLNLGSAVTAPLIVTIMLAWGWQLALVATGVPMLVLVAAWSVFGRDRPAEHPAIGADELMELASNPELSAADQNWLAQMIRLLRNRPLVWLTVSYALMNYVFYLLTFWCFLYLIQERHFAVLEGGWLAALPFLAAAVASAAGGPLTQWSCRGMGSRWGYRLVPLIALPLGGACLVLAVSSGGAYWAVVALCAAFAFTELTEAPFWAAAMRAAPSDSMVATGVLNTGGNLGGIVATPFVAWLSGDHHWTGAFLTGAVCACASAAIWLVIDVAADPVARICPGTPGTDRGRLRVDVATGSTTLRLSGERSRLSGA